MAKLAADAESGSCGSDTLRMLVENQRERAPGLRKWHLGAFSVRLHRYRQQQSRPGRVHRPGMNSKERVKNESGD
jgi:hypothetical protein